MHALESRVWQTIRENALLAPHGRVVIGLSGGADSVALLHVLLALEPLLPLRITAVHLNHSLRGEEADADAAFCQSLCAQLGVECRIVKSDVSAYAAQASKSLELAGRTLRYALFAQVASECGAGAIAVAHHQNDQAETLLIRLARGTGAAGLQGMAYSRPLAEAAANAQAVPHLVRPLLDATRAEIEAYCRDKTLAYRTDATNASNQYTRNAVRNILLPAFMQHVNPAAVPALARTARLAAEDESCLQSLAAEHYQSVLLPGVETALSIPPLAALPPALLRRVLRMAVAACGGLTDIHLAHIEQIAALLAKQSGASANLPRGLLVRREFNRLLFTAAGAETHAEIFEAALTPGAAIRLPNSRCILTCAATENSFYFQKKLCTKRIDCDKLQYKLVARTRRPGDIIALPGGKRRLKQYWIDSKTPRAMRETAILVADGNRVLWIVNGITDKSCLADEKSTSIMYIELWEEEE